MLVNRSGGIRDAQQRAESAQGRLGGSDGAGLDIMLDYQHVPCYR
jgi:hypothetical protein